jgi:hypothetical protein
VSREIPGYTRYQAELDQTIKHIRRSGGVAYGVVADVGDKESIYPIVGQAYGAGSGTGRIGRHPDQQ